MEMREPSLCSAGVGSRPTSSVEGVGPNSRRKVGCENEWKPRALSPAATDRGRNSSRGCRGARCLRERPVPCAPGGLWPAKKGARGQEEASFSASPACILAQSHRVSSLHPSTEPGHLFLEPASQSCIWLLPWKTNNAGGERK